MVLHSKSAKDSQKFGKELASKLKGGEVLALVGDLAAGKTTFVQGIAEWFDINERVISPTFILMREYKTSGHGSIQNLYHIDLYRLDTNIDNELGILGIRDLIGKNDGVVIIEWADKARDLLPPNTLWIEFKKVGEDEREIRYEDIS